MGVSGSEDDAAPPKNRLTEVALLCQPAMQNRLFCDHLAHHLTIGSRLVDPAQLNGLLDDGLRRLLLVDMASAADYLQRLCTADGQEDSLGGSKVGLVNVPGDAEVGPYLRYNDLLGIFHEDDPPERVVRGIQAMLVGELWFPRAALDSFLHWVRSNGGGRQPYTSPTSGRNRGDLLERLTPKESEILHAVGEGESNDAIAKRLGVSICTIKTHLCNIYRKLEVNNRIEAALIASQHPPQGHGANNEPD